MADSEQNLPKGKKGWSHHLFKRISWKKNRKRPFKFWQHQRPLKAQLLKSLHQKISSSTFGDYPGMYCGFSVVIKEYKETRELARYKVHVLQQLGDHPSIPLLFGVLLEKKPHHGDEGKSLTVCKAAKNKVSEQKDWNSILHDMAVTLAHIPKCGFTPSTPHHNRFSHVLPLQKLKLPFQNCRILKVITRIVHCARTFRQNRELSGESDVYSLIYLIIKVYPLFKFKAMPSKGLSQVVSTRPSTME
ncbi:hypothetical protein pdam_00016655, partial [Pocillopora damicornis]